MEKLNEIIALITGPHRILGFVLIGLALALLGVQLCYWVARYGRIAKFRNRRRQTPTPVDGISVVVILGDDFNYLEHTLPRIMAQDHPAFELVVMEVASSPEFSDELKLLKVRYPNLASARLDPDPRFRISDKMIFNVGIKTAKYNNILLTTPDAYPVSSKWLECMSKGFENGEVVLGYCGVRAEKGVGNMMMRCSRMMLSLRYVSAAISGRPYRGMLQNIGFTKDLYLAARGFNHLDMTIGEDDLFIQKIANHENTSIVLNPNATLRQFVWNGPRGWWRQWRIRGMACRYYPGWARMAANGELWMRFLFILSIVACALWLPLYTALGAAALWIIRALVVRHQTNRVGKRLGEHGLGWAMVLYDLAEPLAAAAVFISRRIKPAEEMWK